MTVQRDPCLDTLLDLDGYRIELNEDGYTARFRVKQVEACAEKPHGLDYSLTLHAPDGRRLGGFDNDHAVPVRAGPGSKAKKEFDHKHRFRTVRPYDYNDAGTLLVDYWDLVESILDELGVHR